MSSLFYIQKWSYWIGDAEAFAAGEGLTAPAGGELNLPEVPAMVRRRMSRLSRMALRVAFDVAAGQQWPSVFASRHGELHRTMELFAQLCQREPLSPMGFAQSVHNTASGLYAIVAANTQPSTLISAGPTTLMMALLEALALSRDLATPVLLVQADEPLPAAYRPFVDEQELDLALALVVSSQPLTCGERWQLSQQPAQPTAELPRSLLWQLAAGLASGRDQFSCQHGGQRWEWQRG